MSEVGLVDCGSEITIGNVQSLKSRINAADEEFVQVTKRLICETEKWVRQDAEILIASDPPYSLFAGNKANGFTVYRGEDDSIKIQKSKNKVINCGNEITLDYLQSLQSEIKDNHRDFVDATKRLVRDTPKWILSDAEILISTDDSAAYKLYAGNKTNAFVVYKDNDGSIKTKKKARNPVEEINCGTEITLGNVQSLNSKINDEDKDLVDATKNLVTNTQKWVRQDAEICISTNDSTYSLYAGTKTHIFLVYRDENGSIGTKQMKRGWWKLLYDSGFWVKDSIRDGFVLFFDYTTKAIKD